MKKTDIQTGSIFEIPLEKDFGFGYVKIIFSQDVQPDHFENKIIKVYNIFQEEQLFLNTFEKEMFETDDLLMYPLLMNGFPRLRGDNKWKLIGKSSLTDEDKIIPDYIDLNGLLSQENIKRDTKSEYGCALIRNFENKCIMTKNFEAIKHLGLWQHSSSDGIGTLITMQWMKRLGKNIKDFYTQSDFKKIFWLGYAYNQVMTNEIDFTEINFRGRLKANINNRL